MSTSKRKTPAAGMIATAVGLGCALVAGIVIRDYSTSVPIRLGTSIVAAIVGIVVTFSVCKKR